MDHTCACFFLIEKKKRTINNNTMHYDFGCIHHRSDKPWPCNMRWSILFQTEFQTNPKWRVVRKMRTVTASNSLMSKNVVYHPYFRLHITTFPTLCIKLAFDKILKIAQINWYIYAVRTTVITNSQTLQNFKASHNLLSYIFSSHPFTFLLKL